MSFRTVWIGAAIYNLVTIAVCAAILALAPGADAADHDWPQAPAYTFTVPPYGGTTVIPAGVCPFGISDLAATRGRREFPAPRVDTLAFMRNGRAIRIVNGYHRTLRGYVWCG